MSFNVHDVTKSYGAQMVLRGVSFQLNLGDRALLLGANGSGKSTILRCCAGLARPTRGDVTQLPASQLGYASGAPLMYGALTLGENCELFSTLTNSPYQAHIEFWELSSHLATRVDELSLGLQARAGLFRAFLSSPHYVFLDEPTGPLDDRGVSLLNSMLLGQGPTTNPMAVLMATHDIARTQSLATRILVLQHGVIAKDADTTERAEAIAWYQASNR